MENNLFSDVELNESNDPSFHWIGMPECVNNKVEPYAKIIVRFETQKDFEEFQMLIGQKLTKKTKSIWHPYKSHFGSQRAKYGYSNEK